MDLVPQTRMKIQFENRSSRSFVNNVLITLKIGFISLSLYITIIPNLSGLKF